MPLSTEQMRLYQRERRKRLKDAGGETLPVRVEKLEGSVTRLWEMMVKVMEGNNRERG